ncbi:MAG: UDP-galactopyranose mutase [Actinomycetota bacterium]
MTYDIVIVGAGITGCTLAERFARVMGRRVLVLEKRPHIGGNCYDYLDAAGIMVPAYGPHFFHTDDEEVWEYLSGFTSWHPYEHRVLSWVDSRFVPVPVNIDTVNILTGANIRDEGEMRAWLTRNVVPIDRPANSEESALARVGPLLYEKLFKNYTIKQWSLHPRELDAAVMDRIPVRTDRDDRYFSDAFQAMPEGGYTAMFGRMLEHENIHVATGSDYFAVRDALGRHELLVFTGPIDRFFEYRFGRLQYRSLYFEHRTLDIEYFQPRAQINYPNDEEYTRITEPKHATGQVGGRTTIIEEYSTWEGEPYYPVPSPANAAVYERYREAAQGLEGVAFAGRLGEYRYLNMDQAFANALRLFERLRG